MDDKQRIFALQNLAMQYYIKLCIDLNEAPKKELFEATTSTDIKILTETIKNLKLHTSLP